MNYYNDELKHKFLNEYTESTQGTYKRIFVKSLDIENALNKDLYDFNKDEIESILYDMAPTTSQSAQSNGRMITAYINWATNKGLKRTTNPLATVSNQWFNKFVDKNIQLYISEQTLSIYESGCENAQDALCLRLPFEGVSGRELSEIRNLSKDDVDFEKRTLRLTNLDGEVRYIEIFSDRTLELIQECIEVRTYIKRNGLMVEHENVRDYTDLVENNYVLRSSVTRTYNDNEPADKSVIYRRITMIRETLGIPYLNSKNILRSGMIFMAKNLYEERGKLEKEEYTQIAERFGISKWFSIKEFCNIDAIRELYGDVYHNAYV